jgi:hypothetical protein
VLVAFAVWPGRRKGRLVPALLLLAYVAVAMHLERALGHDSYWTIHFSHLGASPVEALANPWRLARALPGALTRAVPWLATGAFLGLLRPRLTLPGLLLAAPVLLSGWPGTGNVEFQYGYAPTLLLAPAWIPLVQARPERARNVLAGCLLSAVLLGPVLPVLSPRSFAGRYWVPDSEVRCITAGIPAAAGVSASRPLTLLAHRRHLYLWPHPFQAAPAIHLPAAHLGSSDPYLAADIDYVILPRDHAALVPEGFLADGSSRRYLRYRRAATTATIAPETSCE